MTMQDAIALDGAAISQMRGTFGYNYLPCQLLRAAPTVALSTLHTRLPGPAR